jgi:hypothetical protein
MIGLQCKSLGEPHVSEGSLAAATLVEAECPLCSRKLPRKPVREASLFGTFGSLEKTLLRLKSNGQPKRQPVTSVTPRSFTAR